MLRLLTLARWLGPWADAGKTPSVPTREAHVDATRVRIYGGPSASCVLLAPGLHYAGPDDPRLDRFCRILARAGHVVVAPFIRDYLALVPGTRAIADFARVFDELPVLRGSSAAPRKPIVLSISFGSLLAFAFAADRHAELDRLVAFGGYADFHATMRFCLTGQVASGRRAVRDPLNQPVVMLNLLDHLDYARAHRAALEAGWRAYVERTWGRPEMKARERFVAIADDIAPSIPEAVRELFLIGIGARDGAWQLAEPALRVFDARPLDPTPYLARVRGRVELLHGADDDVIPFEQSHALGAALVNANARVHVTGMYGHTGAATARLAALPRELATMVRALRAMS